jgi:hypothetical protein
MLRCVALRQWYYNKYFYYYYYYYYYYNITTHTIGTTIKGRNRMLSNDFGKVLVFFPLLTPYNTVDCMQHSRVEYSEKFCGTILHFY